MGNSDIDQPEKSFVGGFPLAWVKGPQILQDLHATPRGVQPSCHHAPLQLRTPAPLASSCHGASAMLFPTPGTLFLPLCTRRPHCRQQDRLALWIPAQEGRLLIPSLNPGSKTRNVPLRHANGSPFASPRLPHSSCRCPLVGGGEGAGLASHLHDRSWMMEVKMNLCPCLRRKSCSKKSRKAIQQRMVDRIMVAWTTCIVA